MGRSWPDMTPSYSDIEKGDVKYGVSSSQEKITSESRRLDTSELEEENNKLDFYS
ncbi:hypothetical protein J1N35_045018 [Gossypium stocksii]|uniref:Uncharacterized protein n=1 Tax=Gossypium stocksii TaxID=47602 RepID=A0A9D3UAC4_9ROSI|nr:hypothetical protein J1N35_045018 [Gossypium stocksii]